MLVSLVCFAIFNFLYQIFSVIFVYGLDLFSSSIPTLLRDFWRCGMVLISWIIARKWLKKYLQIFWKSWIIFLVLLIFSVALSYFVGDGWFSNWLIGIKYGFWRVFILLSATLVWWGLYYLWFKSTKWLHSKVKLVLLIIVIIGYIWQLLKLWKPERFAMMWYNLKLDDFAFWVAPPIYYLTGFEGTLRRGWLFSGPNNYGYFLVAFLPFVLSQLKNKRDWILLVLWILAIVLTLSRAAILGGIIVFILMNLKRLKEHKKAVLWWGIWFICLIVLFSLRKWASTVGHLTGFITAIQEVFAHPMWYWLGSSGPAIHHSGKFLPENWHLQILLDIGVLWAGMLWLLVWNIWKIIKTKLTYDEIQLCLYGMIALMVMGLTLHVFEDSMVNYIFFGFFGVIIGLKARE